MRDPLSPDDRHPDEQLADILASCAHELQRGNRAAVQWVPEVLAVIIEGLRESANLKRQAAP